MSKSKPLTEGKTRSCVKKQTITKRPKCPPPPAKKIIKEDIQFGKNKEEPYLKIQRIELRYNPAYGDDRICRCDHPYYRHFDTYDSMALAGCKYCGCFEFVEKS